MSYFELIDIKISVSEKEQPVKLVVDQKLNCPQSDTVVLKHSKKDINIGIFSHWPSSFHFA